MLRSRHIGFADGTRVGRWQIRRRGGRFGSDCIDQDGGRIWGGRFAFGQVKVHRQIHMVAETGLEGARTTDVDPTAYTGAP
ncbi:MAG: hypothetical protein QOD58_4889, partial [Mycobacterium sp.]|nr:hypothetical protein [Mycobacterium sp.]